MKTWQKRLGGTTAVLGGIALCAVGLWLLLSPDQYRATVKIKVEYWGQDVDVEEYYQAHP